ncbi:MAG: PIN domain-containing protein [Campylobacterales bacterium]|nr:PIN domain-containing protein [Campylobacterales bacterium]
MQTKRLFFDANILNDIFDDKRSHHLASKEALAYALEHDFEVMTSCDIATNIYYITSKYTTPANALDALELLKDTVEIIPFAKDELSRAIELMRSDSDYNDMEDTIQYILALKMECEIIVSNDKYFVGKELEVLSANEFIDKNE